MIRFFPKNYKIEHHPRWSEDSSFLYTVPRQERNRYDWIPITLSAEYKTILFNEVIDEVIEEKSEIIDLRSLFNLDDATDECLHGYFQGIIYDKIRDVVSWYRNRMNFFGVRDKPSIAKMLRRQGFIPFLSTDDPLKITVVVRFYEKKEEEEYIKKEEREVLNETTSLLSAKLGDTSTITISTLLDYEFEKAWPSHVLPSQYCDFRITYRLSRSDDAKDRPCFEDIC